MEQIVVAAQLKDCVLAAGKGLKKINDKQATSVTKVKTDAETKALEIERSQLLLRAQELKKQVGKLRTMGSFNLDWVALGHLQIEAVDADAKLQLLYKPAEADTVTTYLDVPLIVKGSAILTKCLSTKSATKSTMTEWLGKWEASFDQSKYFKANDRCQAVLEAKHDAVAMTEFFNMILPASMAVANDQHPMLSATNDPTFFFGYAHTMVWLARIHHGIFGEKNHQEKNRSNLISAIFPLIK